MTNPPDYSDASSQPTVKIDAGGVTFEGITIENEPLAMIPSDDESSNSSSGSNGNPDSGKKHDPIGMPNTYNCGFSLGTGKKTGTTIVPDNDTGLDAHWAIENYLSLRYAGIMRSECYTYGMRYRIDVIATKYPFTAINSYLEIYQIKPISWINDKEKCDSYMNDWIDEIISEGFANDLNERIRNESLGTVPGVTYLDSLNGTVLPDRLLINKGMLVYADIQLITDRNYPGYIFYKCYYKNLLESLAYKLSLGFIFSRITGIIPNLAPAY